MMKIAIMQPYFMPYAGYFRLFHATDLFVIYDCVQFPRRGWVHRNQLINYQNTLQWLTLPIAKAAQTTKIKDLTFSDQSVEVWQDQKTRFPVFSQLTKIDPTLSHSLENFHVTPTDYLELHLKKICQLLGFKFNTIRSSSLHLPDELKGQDRILAIAKHFNANTYLNAPGGRELYDEEVFKHHNIKLEFLSNYKGIFTSILHRAVSEDKTTLYKEIIEQC